MRPLGVVFSVVAGTAAFIGLAWLAGKAEGTDWAIGVVAAGIGLIWLVDMVACYWPSKQTRLERFEERQERRAA